MSNNAAFSGVVRTLFGPTADMIYSQRYGRWIAKSDNAKLRKMRNKTRRVEKRAPNPQLF